MQPETQPTDPLLEGLEESLSEVTERRDESIIDWYCKVMLEIQASEDAENAEYKTVRDAIDGSHEVLLKAIQRRREAVEWKHGAEVMAEANREVEGQKKRYVQTRWGRVGFRHRSASDKVIIDNEEVALAAAKQHCPSAVKVTEKILVSLLDGFPLPGTRAIHEDERDIFYFKAFAPKETEDE